jgi:hypothetical protein
MSKQTKQEKCPKCSRPVTSTYQYRDKKFYYHGEGGKMPAQPGQDFDLRLASFCLVEVNPLDGNRAKAVTVDYERERRIPEKK